jgi:hypothetical protein
MSEKPMALQYQKPILTQARQQRPRRSEQEEAKRFTSALDDAISTGKISKKFEF